MAKKIEERIHEFEKYYLVAYDFYLKEYYDLFFTNIRPALEKLAKLIISDVLGENVIVHIANGSAFKIDSRTYSPCGDNPPAAQGGGAWITQAGKVLRFKYKNIVGKKEVRNWQNLFNTINTYYNIGSKDGSHDSEEHTDLLDAQASACITTIFSLLGMMKPHLSYRSFEDLPRPYSSLQEDTYSVRGVQISQDIDNLNAFTNQFDPTVKYVLFTPRDFDTHVGNYALSNIFRIHWSLVVDYNQGSENGLSSNIPSKHSDTIVTIKDSSNQITDGTRTTNWIFALGQIDDPVTIVNTNHERIKRRREIIGHISTFLGKGSISPVTFVSLFSEQDEVNQILSTLFNMINGLSDRSKIVAFHNNNISQTLKLEELIDEVDLSPEQYLCVNVPIEFWLKNIETIKPTSMGENLTGIYEYQTNRGLLTLDKYIHIYQQAGLELPKEGNLNSDHSQTGDFYKGEHITWDELSRHYDVTRDKYETIFEALKNFMRRPKVTVYTIYARPGAGSTTISRRLAYDIFLLNQQCLLERPVLVVFLKKFDKITTIAKLDDISQRTGNTKILLIAESKVISQRQVNYLTEGLQQGEKNITILYVVTTTKPQEYGHMSNSHSLSEILTPREKRIFADIYSQHAGLSMETKNFLLSKQRTELLDFPISANDTFVNEHIQSYVNSWMEELPKNIREFCAYAAFASYFAGGLFINESLLKPIIGSSYELSIMYTVHDNEKEALYRIFITDTNSEGNPIPFWKPRYSVFAPSIINSVWINWKDRVHEIGKNLINIIKQNGHIDDEDMNLLNSVFIERRERDFRSNSFMPILQKFSTLIESIQDLDRAEGVLGTLRDAFPNEPYFAAHFARFLFEKASSSNGTLPDDAAYIKAQQNIDNALVLDGNSDDIFHIRGMFYRRRIASLLNAYKSHKTEYTERKCRELLTLWVDEALHSFDKCINLVPTSAYGYVAKSQLIREAIEFEQILRGTKKGDYSFIEDDEYWHELVDELGATLDYLNGICQQFRGNSIEESPANIKETISMYDQGRLYYASLIGINDDIINRYRKRINSESTEMKGHYRKLFCDALILSKMTNTSSEYRAYGKLNHNELAELIGVLNDRRNSGDVTAYEKLFNLRIYRNEEFPLDEIIDLLRSWEGLCISSNVSGFTLLRARFLLASIYAVKAIVNDLPNIELCEMSRKYFEQAREMANTFNYTPYGSRLSALYFLGYDIDIHALVPKQAPIEDRRTVSGRIFRIDKRNQGWMRLKCGLEVSFNAEGYDAQLDIDKEISGQLGFRYQGLGLYKPNKVELNDHIWIQEEITSQNFESEQSFKEQIKKEEVSKKENIYKTESESIPLKTPTVIDKIILNDSKYKVNRRKKEQTIVNLEEDQLYTGKINLAQRKIMLPGYKWRIKIDITKGFFKDYSPKEYDYSENEEVIFEIKKIIHYVSGEPFPYAINIRPKMESGK